MSANHGQLSARYSTTGQPVLVAWQDGVITRLEPLAGAVDPELWLAPPLLDLQVNGYAGIDFQQDDITQESLVHASRALAQSGCTAFLLTLMTDHWPVLLDRLSRLRRLRAASPELREAIAGWHIEGPFLSPEPGFHGAHDPSCMQDPTPEQIRKLREVAGPDPVLLTLAPERLNSIASIAAAVAAGIKVSLGHTNAPAKRLRQAIKAGASAFTHLGNGCPALLDRGDNILWRVLECPGLLVSLIPDGVHVSPHLFRLIHRFLGPQSIYYITDAMAGAAAPPGTFRLGRLTLEIGQDQVVHLPGTQNLAGSALQPVAGVFRAAEMLDCPWTDAWQRFSDTPARFIGRQCGLVVGGPATFCKVEILPPNRLGNLTTYIRGVPVPGSAPDTPSPECR